MHVHTYRCKHAEGTSEDMIKAGIQKGLPYIGINDHFPMRYLPDPVPVLEYAMELEEFPMHVQELEVLRKRHEGTIEVKIGAEVDYYEPATVAIVESLEPFLDDFDYLYGSVHVVTDWTIDDENFMYKWAEVGIDNVYSMYYDALASMARSRLFDVVGHFDLPKKFQNFPTIDVDDKIDAVLDEVKVAGMVVEVNTAGLRKPVQEIYPSRHILEKILDKQIGITLGSDAHKPEDVGYAFDEAIAMIKAVGFDHVVTFTKRVKQEISLD